MPRRKVKVVVKYVDLASLSKTFTGNDAAQNAAGFIQDLPPGRYISHQNIITIVDDLPVPAGQRAYTAAEVAAMDGARLEELRKAVIQSADQDVEEEDETPVIAQVPFR